MIYLLFFFFKRSGSSPSVRSRLPGTQRQLAETPLPLLSPAAGAGLERQPQILESPLGELPAEGGESTCRRRKARFPIALPEKLTDHAQKDRKLSKRRH